ncbi:hypothetical protein RA280_11725 [Cupriavidus sp. CV2]|uniref:hypothetical protein n=1 Tax=Cupriavidus ulmosensis TaxID=3065913 RepID=UPI00296B3529|nr:hypothetical protein [Cupriavidus sp. CV2]MDW3682406.1 hypothetical protein [Cupriavidus sp. CV2]
MAHTKVELPDIVNVLIEELIRVRCDPPNMMLIDQAITASMPQISILDVLTETEQCPIRRSRVRRERC